jgi:hypothetical protein
MLCRAQLGRDVGEIGAHQIPARHDGVARAHWLREVVHAHDLWRPGCRAGLRAHEARPWPVLRHVRAVAEHIDLAPRLVLAIEPVSELARFRARLHICHCLVVGGLDDGLNVLRMRVRVLEQRNEVRVLRVDAALERGLAGVSVMIASLFRVRSR